MKDLYTLKRSIRMNCRKSLIGILLMPLLGWGQVPVIRNVPGGIPQPPPGVPGESAVEMPEVAEDDVLAQETAPPLQRIFLGESREAVLALRESAEGPVVMEGLSLVEERGGRALEEALSRQLGRPMSERTLQAAGQQIHQYYISRDRPILLVHLVLRDEESGDIGFMVREGVLGEVRSEGARWFNNDWIARQVRLQPGGPIDRRVLVRDVDWLNQNPFRHIDVVFTPGREALHSDLVLQTTDRVPVRVFAGVENTGSESVGEWRGNLGVQWGNAFGLDHQLAYQFSSAFEDFDAQRVHALTWSMPLPWRHQLNWYLSYVDSFYNLGQEASYGGDSWQLSPRYTFPLSSRNVGWTHDVGLGFDFKRSDYAVSFEGEKIPTNLADIAQLVLEYSAAHASRQGRTSGTLAFIYSPGGLSSRNEDADFQMVDPRADSEYGFLTASLRRTQWLPKGLSLSASVTGQYAPDVLLSTENLGIGGYSTVRGYEERVLFGDSGAYGGLELRTGNLLVGARGLSLQGLTFVDAGWVTQSEEVKSLKGEQHMISAGLGIRAEWAPYASFRVDVGFPLDTTDDRLSDSPRAHLSLVMGF